MKNIDLNSDTTSEKIGNNEAPIFGTGQTYLPPIAGKIACVSVGLPAKVNSFNTENVELVKGMNFNAVMADFYFNSSSTPTNISNSFNALTGKDLKFIVGILCPSSNELNLVQGSQQWLSTLRLWRNIVTTFLEKDNLGGWFLSGNPSYSVLWKLSEIKDAILSTYARKKKYNPHSIFTSLYLTPSWVEANGLIRVIESDEDNGESTEKIVPYPVYLDYIPFNQKPDNFTPDDLVAKDYYQSYYSIFNPALWVYDDYVFEASIGESGTVNTRKPVLRKDFFKAMMRVKRWADLTKKTFWGYVKTDFYKNVGTTQRARPTLGTLRFAAFCPLAFGAKGIMFGNTFMTVKSSELSSFNPENRYYIPAAPVLYKTDDNGNNGVYQKTDIYDIVATVNEEIEQISSLMNKSTFIKGGIYTDNQNEVYEGLDIITTPFSVNGYEDILDIRQSGSGLIISKFRNTRNDTNVYVFINADYENVNTVTIKFKDFMKCEQMDYYFGGLQRYEDVEMGPGQCLVFSESKDNW